MGRKATSDFPLFKHRNGQWAKKVKGRLHYFGTDREAALEKWIEEKDYLLAGRRAPRHDGSPSLAELANVFLHRCSDPRRH